MKQAAKKADQAADMSSPELLGYMYENAPKNIQEQIEKYQAKESK